MRAVCTAATTLIVLLVVPAGAAFADDSNDGDITDRQRQLNDRGVDAIDDGDYDEAIELYESSLELGELNIIHTNLGRAHQLAGNCQEADAHFERALTAPAVDRPPPEVVEETIDDYRADLDNDCPGALRLDCEPDEMEVFVDDDGPGDCHPDPRELAAGDYEVRGEYGDHTLEETVAIEALETTRLKLHLDDPVDPPADVEAADSTVPDWLWLAGGAAAVGTGIALDTVPDSASNYEVNAVNFVPPVMYLGGAGLGIVGIRGILR